MLSFFFSGRILNKRLNNKPDQYDYSASLLTHSVKDITKMRDKTIKPKTQKKQITSAKPKRKRPKKFNPHNFVIKRVSESEIIAFYLWITIVYCYTTLPN